MEMQRILDNSYMKLVYCQKILLCWADEGLYSCWDMIDCAVVVEVCYSSHSGAGWTHWKSTETE